jgi:hypothetical protein
MLFISVLFGCSKNEDTPAEETTDGFFDFESSRNFRMGFTTWPFAPTTASVEDTYMFLARHTDVYSEHIDSNIPWDAWINDLPLPQAFISDISGRASRRLPGTTLSLSVSLLNNDRDELAFDFDGSVPAYTSLDDTEIVEAYIKHLEYITIQLNPDYLILAIEVNELLIHAPQKWEAYKSLMSRVRSRIQERFPEVLLSESITLHNLYQPGVADPEGFIDEVVDYANGLDLVAISFYPFFKGLQTKGEFQDAFDFLHERINRPIVFAETGHLSEDLNVPGLDLFIPGNETEQRTYLETLLENAQEQEYAYAIWWTHRDYDALWEVFPEDQKDFGQLWISTGIVNENGELKASWKSWEKAFNVPR